MRCFRFFLLALVGISFLPPVVLQSQTASSSSSHAGERQSASAIDAGTVSEGVYHNGSLGFTCKIPSGWVLRTEEMNARDDDEAVVSKDANGHAQSSAPAKPATNESGRVLLAAFSRPPQARAQDVNTSILIAAESAEAYPGLKEAGQYLGPISEVAKAQGFAVSEEPYEFAVGGKTLAREDFQKDVGTRVMRQSTLVMLARGYAISFTFIGGTEDEVEELIRGLSLQGVKHTK